MIDFASLVELAIPYLAVKPAVVVTILSACFHLSSQAKYQMSGFVLSALEELGTCHSKLTKRRPLHYLRRQLHLLIFHWPMSLLRRRKNVCR